MKTTAYCWVLIISFLSIIICGCPPSGGGSDDNEAHGTPPTITDVVYYKCDDREKNNCLESNTLNYLGYYHREIYCSDPDFDIKYLHWTVYVRKNDQLIVDEGPEMQELSTQEYDPVYYYWTEADIVYAPRGRYKFEYQLEDQARNLSNIFYVLIDVE